ncbi:glycine zipper domain-containing protein [Mesorhizobium sp. WSM2239]|jgi:hypothetical protein|uniref:Glycine zipper domain-containing protein n=2 Tax=unclassified Mesorhizobium TaxID=325217 RepID=A0AAU8D1A3_9HYPH
MRNMLIAVATVAALTACSQTERGAVIGGATGAIVGGAATGDAGGAVVGGGIGAVAGALIGNASEPGKCYYRDRYGRRFIADC